MIFNSGIFIFAFLPCVLLLYFILGKFRKTELVISGLILCSLVYYAWWKIEYVPILLSSLLVNFVLGQKVSVDSNLDGSYRLALLRLGLVLNLSLLAFFKYMNFFLETTNQVFDLQWTGCGKLALPLGISFFTFQQIAYLVDSYKGIIKEKNFKIYILYVLFFPHLIAGPLVLHADIMPQFRDRTRQKLQYTNVARGLFLFSMGLFKKLVIADHLSPYVSAGFNATSQLSFLDAWLTALMYTLQLYFDFSGYCDMAIGVAEMLNIHLPINFYSPYQALNIQDFWRRWHISLSKFLRDYVYIPLGGNQSSLSRTCTNLMITFLLGGLWHGAGWTFLFWGFLHGMAVVVYRLYARFPFYIPRFVAWLITFQFVNLAWVYFRADSWRDATRLVKNMYGRNGIVLPLSLQEHCAGLQAAGFKFGTLMYSGTDWLIVLPLVAGGLCMVLFFRNSLEWRERFRPNWYYFLFTYFLFMISIIDMNKTTAFLYYDF